jgi:hypothetical protein
MKSMGRSHWEMVLMGAAGGALIVASVFAFANLDGLTKLGAVLMLVFGLLVILYGRYK